MKLARLLFIAAALAPWESPADQPAQTEVFHYEQVLGTSLELKVFVASHEQALRAESAVLSEIDRLAGILSSYDADSEVSRWMRTRDKAVPVSAELFRVLRLFDDWRVKTGGALDPAAAAVSQVWREAETRQQLPSDAALAGAVAAISRRHWLLDGTASHATHLSGTPLVFNSLAKSFIIELAASAAMKASTAEGLILNLGGDIIMLGKVREVIAIADPLAEAENAPALDRIVVTGGAVATSGNYRRGFDIQGRHYSHIVDPRTGRTAEAILSATVVAPDGATAGAMATSMCVLTPEESARLAAKHPGTDYLIVARDGRRFQSEGWSCDFPHRASRASARSRHCSLSAFSPRCSRRPRPSPRGTNRWNSWSLSNSAACRTRAIGGPMSRCGLRTRTSFPCAQSRCGMGSHAGSRT
jgi:FAD:protein FMN transferase